MAIRNRNRRFLRRSGCNMPRGCGSLPSATGQHWTRSFRRTSANCGSAAVHTVAGRARDREPKSVLVQLWAGMSPVLAQMMLQGVQTWQG